MKHLLNVQIYVFVNGKGTGVVIATGDETFMGRTAQLATTIEG